MTLPEALEASCDTYFYELGYKFYALPPERGQAPLQDWASRFGFGESTGVDVGPDEAGLLPTPEWREQDLHEGALSAHVGDRPPLEAGRLDPARDRPEGPAR